MVEMTLSEQAKDALIAAAVAARGRAYAPYSGYSVGAALLADNGRIYAGCNVENASYGLSCCAERTAVFAAVGDETRIIRAVAVVTEDAGPPCGACRQVLAEFAPRDGAAVNVILLNGDGAIVRETTLSDLLPYPFAIV
jgi:cytidine deaminase